MNSNVKGKDFITTQDWTVEELNQVFDLAGRLQRVLRPTGCQA